MSGERWYGQTAERGASIARAVLCAATVMVMTVGGTGCAPRKESTRAASGTPGAPPVKFEEAKAKIQADPNIPEAQKAMLLRQMQDQSAQKAPPKM